MVGGFYALPQQYLTLENLCRTAVAADCGFSDEGGSTRRKAKLHVKADLILCPDEKRTA